MATYSWPGWQLPTYGDNIFLDVEHAIMKWVRGDVYSTEEVHDEIGELCNALLDDIYDEIKYSSNTTTKQDE